MSNEDLPQELIDAVPELAPPKALAPMPIAPNGPSKKAIAAASLAAALAAPCEGLRHYVYADPVGIQTYCFGETRNPIPGKFYSTAECKDLLTSDMAKVVSVVDKCQPGLPVSVLGAFGSAAYNMGPTLACNTKSSAAARYLAAKQYIKACDQLPNWDKARVAGVEVALPGLVKRRAEEQAACLKGLS